MPNLKIEALPGQADQPHKDPKEFDWEQCWNDSQMRKYPDSGLEVLPAPRTIVHALELAPRLVVHNVVLAQQNARYISGLWT